MECLLSKTLFSGIVLDICSLDLHNLWESVRLIMQIQITLRLSLLFRDEVLILHRNPFTY